MELTTDQKGAVAEIAVMREAAELGYGVIRPITDGHPYDLVLEVGGRLLRVQCKWAPRRGDVIVVPATRCRRVAGGGLRRRTYSAEEVDFVAAYCHELNACWAVPIDEFGASGHLHLRLTAARNGQRAGLHFAEQYGLGAIAQLEERRHGMAEVVGSSPTSSTPTGARAAPVCAEGALVVHAPVVVGAHEFRNRFGWYMERAAAGEEVHVTHRGRPRIRVAPIREPLRAAA